MATLSTGKRVSERIIELLNEVEQRGLVPVEIILGSRASELLKDEVAPHLIRESKVDGTFFHGIQVTVSNVEAAEFVGIDCEI